MSRNRVVGYAAGVDVNGAIEDAISNAPPRPRPMLFTLLDVTVFDAGGFTGAKRTGVMMAMHRPT
jgi:hypothetical protein